jgi:subtilisin family serine protease
MKKLTFTFLSFVLNFGLIASSYAQEYYVKTKNISFKWPSEIEKSETIHITKSASKGESEQLLRIRFSPETNVNNIIKELRENDSVFWVEEVLEYELLEKSDATTSIPNDPFRASQQPWLESIQASATWEKGSGSSDVIIAIIDTGVDYNHEDLAANRWINEDEIPENGIDDDQNGYIDDVNGWDFFEENGNPLPKGSSNNHGTHVAGLAAAVTNNGTGISALSYNTRFMPIKISDNNGRNLRYAVESILYAVDNGAAIINCSWGSTRYSRALEDAINYAWEKGVLVIGAAGNDGSTSVYYPAGYARSIAVGAINFRDLKKSSFSNYGGFIDVLAPGGETSEGLLSTLPNNTYGTSFGTSMASPLVASALGIIKSIESEWDAATLRAQLEAHAVPLHTQNAAYSFLLGDGLIQPAQSLLTDLKARVNMLFFHFGDRDNVATVFNRNDEFDVFLDVENLGISDNAIRIDAISMNNSVEVLSGNGMSYAAQHGELFETQVIRFRVSPDAQVNTKARIRFEFTYSDASKSWEVIEVNLVPDHLVHSINTIELGLNGTGRIGFFNYPSNTEGSGFIIKQEGTTQAGLTNIPLLKEAGLLYGTSTSRISSAIRGLNNSVILNPNLIQKMVFKKDARNLPT